MFLTSKSNIQLQYAIYLLYQDKVSLGSAGYPGTSSVDRVGFELRDPSAPPKPVVGLKASNLHFYVFMVIT